MRTVALLVSSLLCSLTALAAEPAFPKEHWESRTPEDLHLDPAALDALSQELGGRGCVIKDGYVVKAWGDQAEIGDWFSSAKPVLSTLLFFALEEGKVKSVDQPIVEFGWPLSEKDKGITFRHLGAMSSGYARPEGAGQAWAYNDFAIQLYQKTLFEKVFQQDAKTVADDPARLGALGFEDGLVWNKKARLKASVRDFSRIVWLWLNHGRWGEKQVLPAKYFEEYMHPQAPKDLPQTAQAETDDYLGIESYGGGSDHFSSAGPGVYGFNWWFNDTGRLHPDALTWPDAPKDTVMSLGARGNSSAIIPSLGIALACASGDWGEVKGGEADNKMNRVLGLLAKAAQAPATPQESASAAPPAGAVGPEVVRPSFPQGQPLMLSFEGPRLSEEDAESAFRNYRMSVTLRLGDQTIEVPGYFAADGNAAETSASAGNVWRIHFLPPAQGIWKYTVSLRHGGDVALSTEPGAGEPAEGDGHTGEVHVGPPQPEAPGYLGKGLLQYVGQRYLRFSNSGDYYLKGGADSPENFLAYYEFDATEPSHKFEPHAGDWREGDPTWQSGKGKNIIGALNYLASKKMNVVYFLTMNVKGDGKDVWPWTGDEVRDRFDVSKLAQWEIVLSHMDRLGILLHVVTQEQENDQLLDGGELGPERKLYYRELIARFAHHPALVWNLGEENTNTTEQLRAFAEYIHTLDPYDHPVVVHTFPKQYDKVYTPLLADPNIEGPSLQLGHMETTYDETLKWVQKSAEAGRPWFVCLDEIGPANTGVKPDADDPEHDDVRRHALWGNLMAGGSGSEWLFGYKYAHNDINCEDWRSRDIMWDQTRFAVEFFQQHLPFWEMEPVKDVLEGPGWCLAKPGEVYAVYSWDVENLKANLPQGNFSVSWYDPKHGGALVAGEEAEGSLSFTPPAEGVDWVILLRKK